MIWRANDTQPSDDAPAPGTPAMGAVGELAPAQAPKPPEQDIDKLTEKVWQRIRRTLQLERERHRGLP